jgi:hypothetical protein
MAKQLDRLPDQDDRVYVAKRADCTELASGYSEATRSLKALEKEHEKQKARSRGSDFEL